MENISMKQKKSPANGHGNGGGKNHLQKMYQEYIETDHVPTNIDHMDVRKMIEEITLLKSELTLLKKKVTPESSESGSNTNETNIATSKSESLKKKNKNKTSYKSETVSTENTINANSKSMEIANVRTVTPENPKLEGKGRHNLSLLQRHEDQFPPINQKQTPKKKLQNQNSEPEKATSHLQPSEYVSTSNYYHIPPPPVQIRRNMAPIPNIVEMDKYFDYGNIRKPKKEHLAELEHQRYLKNRDQPTILRKRKPRPIKKHVEQKKAEPVRAPDFTPITLPCQSGFISAPSSKTPVTTVSSKGRKADSTAIVTAVKA